MKIIQMSITCSFRRKSEGRRVRSESVRVVARNPGEVVRSRIKIFENKFSGIKVVAVVQRGHRHLDPVCLVVGDFVGRGLDVVFADPAILKFESGNGGDRLRDPLEGVTGLLVAVGRRLDADGTGLAWKLVGKSSLFCLTISDIFSIVYNSLLFEPKQ